MKKTLIVFSISLLISGSLLKAQTNTFPLVGSAGIGTTTPNASALLELMSTSKGLLISRMTKAQRDAIPTPEAGLMIYQTNASPGFYYYDGAAWTRLVSGTGGANKSLNNLNTTTAVNADLRPDTNNLRSLGNAANSWKDFYLDGALFLKDQRFLAIDGSGTNTYIGQATGINNTSGSGNSFGGDSSGFANTIGFANTGFGYRTLRSNTSAYYNTAFGNETLVKNTTGNGNTAMGYYTMNANTTGFYNTALGFEVMPFLTTGYNNTGVGFQSMLDLTSGFYNTAIGEQSMQNTTTGNHNTAIGRQAMDFNTTGNYNTALGTWTMQKNLSGNYNIAIGIKSLYSTSDRSYNIAIGDSCLYNSGAGVAAAQEATENTAIGSRSMFNGTTGYSNTSLGFFSLYGATTGYENTAIGKRALQTNVTGNNNTALGANADVNSGALNNSMALGFGATATASNQVRIGNSSVTSIGGFANWTNVSDGRLKKNIKENIPGLSFINMLRPVSYNLNATAIDGFLGKAGIDKSNVNAIENVLHTGFIAQEVQKAAQELNFDFDGVDAPQNEKDMYGLRYSEFVVPLVKAVQELSKQNDELKSEIGNLKSEMQKQIDELKKEINHQPSAINNQQAVSLIPLSGGGGASLEQNIPNPFRGTTTISCFLSINNGNAYINFYNQSGALLRSIKVTGEGKNTITLNANELASGTYKYALVVDGKVMDSKMMVKQ